MDIFKYIFPTKEETETIKKVPKRPNNPDPPSKYRGPFPLKSNPAPEDYVNAFSPLPDTGNSPTGRGAWANW